MVLEQCENGSEFMKNKWYGNIEPTDYDAAAFKENGIR